MKKRFTEEQIVRILKEADDGMAAVDVCRKHSIAEATFYRWKSKAVFASVLDTSKVKLALG